MKESIENLVKQLKENDFSAVKIKNYTFDATAVDFYSLDDLMRFCKSQNVNNIFYSKLPDNNDDFVSCEFFAPWNGVLLCYSANTKSIDDEMKSQIKADFGYSKISDEDCFEDEEEDYDDEDEEDGRPITSLQEEINSKYQSLKRKIDSYSMCAGENCEHLFDDENNLLEKKLESLTSKYNYLKRELLDIEEHISFCKENQLQLLNFAENAKNNQNLNQNNFFIFKSKIKTLFEYNEDFMKTNSETAIFNMIIDNIKNLQDENLTLKKTLEDLNNLIIKIRKNDDDINIENNFNNNEAYNNIDLYNNYSPNEYIDKNDISYNNSIKDNIGNNSYANDVKQKSLIKYNNYHIYNLDNNMSNDNISSDNFNNANDINEMNYINENYGRKDVNSKEYFDELMNSVDNLKNVFQ